MKLCKVRLFLTPFPPLSHYYALILMCWCHKRTNIPLPPLCVMLFINYIQQGKGFAFVLGQGKLCGWLNNCFMYCSHTQSRKRGTPYQLDAENAIARFFKIILQFINAALMKRLIKYLSDKLQLTFFNKSISLYFVVILMRLYKFKSFKSYFKL